MVRWLLFFGLLCLSGAQQILTINGRPVDRCLAGLDQNCVVAPPATSTLFIPRAGDPRFAFPGGAAVLLPVTGVNIPTAVTPVCLGRYDPLNRVPLNCAQGCDPAFANGNIAAIPNINGAQGTFTPNLAGGAVNAWNSPLLVSERSPRHICFTGAIPAETGFRWAVTHNCRTDAECGSLISTGDVEGGRTTCCQAPTNQIFTGFTDRVGICINTRFEACCGGVGQQIASEKCCNPNTGAVQFTNGICTCQRVVGGPNGCPASEPNCCLLTKYPELNALTVTGQCYNASRHKCCNTGNIYDPGTLQCCAINGLQSVNTPCPCQVDQDCAGGTSGETLSHKCCKQFWPTPIETPSCSIYTNFPDLTRLPTQTGLFTPPVADTRGIGTGDYHFQRCNGVCMDPAFQICCNGVTCVREYERCCNATCCNRYVGTCAEAIREGTPNQLNNYIGYGIRYEQCSTIEQYSILRAWWVFVLPTMLLALTLIALAFVLAFVNRTTNRVYSVVERGLIILGVLAVLFATPNFFSPAYKYGIVMVVIALVVILSAAERNRWLNLVAIAALILGLFYLFDPFHGENDVLSLSSFRQETNSRRDDESSGILHWIGNKNWRNLTVVNSDQNFCVNYYDYFRLDPQLRDIRRENPLVTTFGYCGRGWITALLIFEAILCFLVIILLVLALIAFFLRFAVESFEPIEIALEPTGYGPNPIY